VAASMRTAVAIGAGILVLGAGIGAGSIASAHTPATPNPTSAPSGTSTPSIPAPSTEPPGWPTDPDQAEREAALVQALSEMLGVDEAEIRAALDQIRAAYAAEGPAALDAWLDQAVQSGILTQEEADAVRQAVEQGVINLGPR
jgi:hypothetical protein